MHVDEACAFCFRVEPFWFYLIFIVYSGIQENSQVIAGNNPSMNTNFNNFLFNQQEIITPS